MRNLLVNRAKQFLTKGTVIKHKEVMIWATPRNNRRFTEEFILSVPKDGPEVKQAKVIPGFSSHSGCGVFNLDTLTRKDKHVP